MMTGTPESTTQAGGGLPEGLTEWALRAIDESIAGPVGERFFRTLARRTAETLGVGCVFISERDTETEGEGLVACWVAGDIAEGALELDRSPLAAAMTSELAHIEARDGAALEFRPSWYGGTPRALFSLRLFDSAGKPSGYFGAIDDAPFTSIERVTTVLKVLSIRCAAELERRRIERALRESEERFRLIVENSRDVIWRMVLHPEPRFEYISPSAERLTGVPLAEFTRDSQAAMNRITPEDDRPFLWPTLADPDRRIRQYVRTDGTQFWGESHNVSVYDARGEAVALQGVTRDVSELVAARSSLEVSEARLRTLIEAFPDPFVRLSPEGKVTHVHAGAGGASALSLDERAIGKQLLDVLPPHIARILAANLEQALGQRVARTTLTNTPGEQTSRWEVRMLPQPDECLVIFRDVATASWVPPEPARQRALKEIEGLAERQLVRRNPFGLTLRELTVLNLVAAGTTDKAIAATLGISTFTVSKHVSSILSKMGVASRTEAAMRGLQEQIIAPAER